MLSALLDDEADLTPLKRLVADKTEGKPFFVEEMVRALFAQGVGLPQVAQLVSLLACSRPGAKPHTSGLMPT
jgi:hypothetical protein